jgi:ATP-dependent Clp protease ATP-binding subunit ClpA
VFERFAEGPRRAVFYARDAAFEQGSPLIEPTHLLLGVEREDKNAVEVFVAEHPAIEKLREINLIQGVAVGLLHVKFSEQTVSATRRAASSSEKEGCYATEIKHLLIGLLSVAEGSGLPEASRPNIAHRLWACIVGRVGGVR